MAGFPIKLKYICKKIKLYNKAD